MSTEKVNFEVMAGSASDAYDKILESCSNDVELSAFFVRGRKMRTLDQLFDEVSAALQFPYYFGENWPAFTECLSDMSWIKSKKIVVVVLGTEELLFENPDEIRPFFRSIELSQEEYEKATNGKESLTFFFHTNSSDAVNLKKRLIDLLS